MTPASFLRDLAAFWLQIAIVVVAIAALLKIVSIPAHLRYVCLRLALLACLVVPWTLRSEVVVTPAAPASERVAPVVATQAGPAETLTIPAHATTAVPPRVLPDIPWTTVALVTLIGGAVIRGLWLIVGVFRLRRMTGRAMPVDSPDYAAVQQQVGTSATIAQVEGLPQPVTFGFRRPIVLLPDTLAAAPAPLRRAVVTHELFHVRRGDWLSVLGEEALRTMLWFHPAILWLTSHIQLAREEMVDELTVRATGDRRAYMEALLAFADTGGFHPAPAFAHRRQLFHRILSVSKEKAMSVPRVVASGVVMVTALAGASWYASTLFPIVVAAPVAAADVRLSSSQELVRPDAEHVAAAARVAEGATAAMAGQRPAAQPAQEVIHEVTPENPIPRRTRAVQPARPSQFSGQSYGVVVNALVRIGRDGNVTNVSDKGCGVTEPTQNDPAVCRAFFDATAAAVRQWRYDRPVQAPLQFSVLVRFRPGTEPAVVQAEEWLRYVRETQDSLRALAEETGKIAIVNQSDFDKELRNVDLRQRLTELVNQFRELERAQRLATEKLNPAHPDLVALQQRLARLNDEMAQLQRELGELNLARARLAALNLVRARAEQNLQQAPTATVSPAPASPDGLPKLVSPSGRTPLRVTPSVTAPVAVRTVKPQHSAEAMRARVEGTVTIEALVDERGRVADARVIKSIPLLDQSALEAAKQWEFRPALLNGEPVPVVITLELNFALRN